ncbi:pdz and lim domain protein hypothetical protein [Limosa lapponica baueri]|uniref:PDZ domain-containing protein n=1 Tax=Limosa lapponica baueri TaxID=1758121 RepID=A0A2I0T9Q4_LIMLA|nr:pdz and lim domain protein hypothetical protein [Limosa lapponica baueri]
MSGDARSKGEGKVTPGSKAAIANLCIGDHIIAIDGENTDNMTHLEAQNKIKGCADELTLTINSKKSKTDLMKTSLIAEEVEVSEEEGRLWVSGQSSSMKK